MLTTDGMMTFVMFRYKSLEWSEPLSQPSPLPHMETGPATAGVNAGDRVNGHNVTNDPENMINLRLVSMSNVGVPGLFIYRIDLGTSKIQSCMHGIQHHLLMHCVVSYQCLAYTSSYSYAGVNTNIRDSSGWVWVNYGFLDMLEKNTLMLNTSP